MAQTPQVNLEGVVIHNLKERIVVKTPTGNFLVLSSQPVTPGQCIRVNGTLRRRVTCSGSFYEILAAELEIIGQEASYG